MTLLSNLTPPISASHNEPAKIREEYIPVGYAFSTPLYPDGFKHTSKSKINTLWCCCVSSVFMFLFFLNKSVMQTMFSKSYIQREGDLKLQSANG